MPHDYIFRTRIIDLEPANRDRGSDGLIKLNQ